MNDLIFLEVGNCL